MMLAHTYVESTMMIEIHRQRTPALLLAWSTAVSALCVSCLDQPTCVGYGCVVSAIYVIYKATLC